MLALKPQLLGPGGLGPPSPLPTSISLPPASPVTGPAHSRMGRDSHAHRSPLFLAAFLWLACVAQQRCHVPAQLRTQVKIHIYLWHGLHFQDRLLLKREEIRFQAALSNRDGQISFLNILSGFDCSSQRGNKKYSFCNPALLYLL